ncbi:MAG: hypothetical protein IJ743_00410 [Bacilli bacterium]|nr:hypothetical protein [Bacilli bacterium]
MILNKKDEKLGKSEAVYSLLLSISVKYSRYLMNIWDIKGNDDTFDLAAIKEILFFEDAIIVLSKKGMGMFINLNQVIAMDLVVKQ